MITDREFRASMVVPASIERVFAFFSDTGNLELITPPHLRFEILTPGPIDMLPGAIIDYRLKIRGVPVRWRTEIAEWNPPERFVDVQIRGPYAKWVHTHTFRQCEDGTEVGDHVVYRIPFGPLGLLALPFVRRDVESIFRFRQNAIGALFGVLVGESR